MYLSVDFQYTLHDQLSKNFSTFLHLLHMMCVFHAVIKEYPFIYNYVGTYIYSVSA